MNATRVALVAPREMDANPALCGTILGLVERGWDAHLVLDGGEEGAPARPRALDPLARRRRLHVSERVPRRLRRRPTLEELLHTLDATIVHFLCAAHARSEVGAAGNGASRVVATFTPGDASVAGLETPGFYDELWSRSDLLHFVDDAVLSSAERRGLPQDRRRTVIPLLVDPDSYAIRKPRPAGRPLRVLCAGKLEWSAGYEHALHGLALAAERGVACECRVVGEGPHLAALLFARLQLGLSGRVTFEGRATATAMAAQLAWADVFLAPTVIDGLPEHVVEAAATGLCLVLANPGPLGDLTLDESLALTVPRRDHEAVAEALSHLANDPAARIAMGSAARAWALERFPMEEQLDRLAEAYRRLLA